MMKLWSLNVDGIAMNGGALSSLASRGGVTDLTGGIADLSPSLDRSEERRVGKEC